MVALRRILLGICVLGGSGAQAQMLTPVWTEVTENGSVARVVVNSPADCPSVVVDGVSLPMTERLPVPGGLRPVCELPMAATAGTASVQGKSLSLPRREPARVIVIGDTGCRVKGTKAPQDCNNPAKWPFRQVANSAAASKPDLVIHVGDYLYREEPCPSDAQASCGGTPAGDTWEAWNADFFSPAAALLSTAPWAFARGNHESCDRSWRGWFYYLDPRPFVGTCDAFTAPYLVQWGELSLVIFDSASASDKLPDPLAVKRYSDQLAGLHAGHAWFVVHHPVWGLKIPATAEPGTPPGESPTELTSAWERSPPAGIDLIVSGHTHLFELLSFDRGRPTQLVAGDGGTEMALPLPAQLAGLKLRGATLLSGENAHEFGYTALTKVEGGWRVSLTNILGQVLESAPLSR